MPIVKRVQAKHLGGCWSLPQNDVWNVPTDVNEVRGEFETKRGCFASIRKYRALAMDVDGFVYGTRSLNKPRESGYDLEGTVSIGGKCYSAFTTSVMFQRADGSFCEVARLYVRTGDVPIDIPNLDLASDDVLEELRNKYHYQRGNSRALIREYADSVRRLRSIASADPTDRNYEAPREHVVPMYQERLVTLYDQFPAWAKFKG